MIHLARIINHGTNAGFVDIGLVAPIFLTKLDHVVIENIRRCVRLLCILCTIFLSQEPNEIIFCHFVVSCTLHDSQLLTLLSLYVIATLDFLRVLPMVSSTIYTVYNIS